MLELKVESTLFIVHYNQLVCADGNYMYARTCRHISYVAQCLRVVILDKCDAAVSTRLVGAVAVQIV